MLDDILFINCCIAQEKLMAAQIRGIDWEIKCYEKMYETAVRVYAAEAETRDKGAQ